MLVRARIKRVEDLPEWAKCCDDFVNEITHYPEFVVDLDNVFVSADGDYSCKHCSADRLPMKWVLDPKDRDFAPFDLLDLDEGPAEAQ